MMTVITNAQEAIRIANSIQGTTQSIVANTKKRFKHWSFYVLLLSSAGGAVAVVVASVMSIYTLIVAGVILCATNALGAFIVRKLDGCEDLAGCVDVMATKIRELALYVKEMQKVNEDLKGVRKDLNNNLKEDIRVWEHGYSEVKKSADQIQNLTNQLDITTKKLKITEELYANLQNAVNKFSNHVVDLNENNKSIDQKVSKLAGKVTDAQVILDSLNDKNANFDENNEIYEKHNNANIAFLERFEQELSKIFSLQTGAKEFRETLEKQGNALEKVSMDINSSLEKIEKLNNNEILGNQKIIDQTEELTNKLNSILEKIIKERDKSITKEKRNAKSFE